MALNVAPTAAPAQSTALPFAKPQAPATPSFLKPAQAPAAPTPAPVQQAPTPVQTAPVQGTVAASPAPLAFMQKAQTPPAQPPAQPKPTSWMATGQTSAKVHEQEQAEQARRKEEQGKAFRFWLEDGETAMITFIDGQLTQTPQGSFLLPPRFYEHNLKLNGRFGNHFVCPEKTMPDMKYKCPICAGGDRATLVAVFSIIDHRQFQGKEGKVYQDTRKLFVANPGAFEQLNQLAMKDGVNGLEGTTWEVSRAGDKSPRTGNNWWFKGKTDLDTLAQHFMYEQKDPKTGQTTMMTKFTPLDYESEIIFRTPEQLLAMGLGDFKAAPSGFQNTAHQQLPAGQNYAEHL